MAHSSLKLFSTWLELHFFLGTEGTRAGMDCAITTCCIIALLPQVSCTSITFSAIWLHEVWQSYGIQYACLVGVYFLGHTWTK
jgi:hypothetical protein